MSIFSYTPTKRLAPGTVIDVALTRQFRLLSFPLTEKAFTQRNTALGGAIESLFFRSELSFSCLTALIEPQSQLENHIIEFLASVQNGEVFTFDRRGTIAVPDNPLTCIITSKSFAEVERGKVFHQYRFTLREN